MNATALTRGRKAPLVQEIMTIDDDTTATKANMTYSKTYLITAYKNDKVGEEEEKEEDDEDGRWPCFPRVMSFIMSFFTSTVPIEKSNPSVALNEKPSTVCTQALTLPIKCICKKEFNLHEPYMFHKSIVGIISRSGAKELLSLDARALSFTRPTLLSSESPSPFRMSTVFTSENPTTNFLTNVKALVFIENLVRTKKGVYGKSVLILMSWGTIKFLEDVNLGAIKQAIIQKQIDDLLGMRPRTQAREMKLNTLYPIQCIFELEKDELAILERDREVKFDQCSKTLQNQVRLTLSIQLFFNKPSVFLSFYAHIRTRTNHPICDKYRETPVPPEQLSCTNA
ncbi:hypothetical protein GQ44DRAFT_728168 [Phaeosphaeriaceae sp. PMI808]|nr:hypothetical protein GQ44DRAFT_728168 [Phaeosphaeriaceae sp. PMI808]